ncbi:MAG: hypothetical protein R3D05_21975 [Dongiaceae bacterium]
MAVRSFLACAGAIAFIGGGVAALQHAEANAYPTEVVTDYVIGCMAANGETQDMLRRCSCSIDTVASILPYQTYERADTIIRMSRVAGGNTEMFRQMTALKKVVDQLRLAQIEADFRCF